MTATTQPLSGLMDQLYNPITQRLCEFTRLAGLLLVLVALAARGQTFVDAFFDPDANSTIRVIVPQTDGKILIGGDFTTLSPNDEEAITRNRIARLNPDG